MVILRASQAEHLLAARRLLVEYAAELGHDLCFQDFARELETLPGAYAPPTGCLLLARAPHEWVGCVALRRVAAGVCEMKRMYVRPAWRGGGIGRRLAQEVIAVARRIGYARMRLDTLAPMAAARGLYESLGFRQIEPYYHNPLPGAVFYELDLSGPAPCYQE